MPLYWLISPKSKVGSMESQLYRHVSIITITPISNLLQFFTAVKIIKIQMKNCDIFLIFAQNIDRWYT